MVNYDDWKQKELREACKERGLPANGTKADMAKRLRDTDGPSKAPKSPANKERATRSKSPVRSKTETKAKSSKSPARKEKPAPAPKKTTKKAGTKTTKTQENNTADDDWLFATIIVLLGYFMLVWCNLLPEPIAAPMKPIVTFFRQTFVKNVVNMLESSRSNQK